MSSIIFYRKVHIHNVHVYEMNMCWKLAIYYTWPHTLNLAQCFCFCFLFCFFILLSNEYELDFFSAYNKIKSECSWLCVTLSAEAMHSIWFHFVLYFSFHFFFHLNSFGRKISLIHSLHGIMALSFLFFSLLLTNVLNIKDSTAICAIFNIHSAIILWGLHHRQYSIQWLWIKTSTSRTLGRALYMHAYIYI